MKTAKRLFKRFYKAMHSKVIKILEEEKESMNAYYKQYGQKEMSL
jgi:hypothetical protein